MAEALADTPPRLDPAKFRDPFITAKGERRAHVSLTRLETLWFNTGAVCNLTCKTVTSNHHRRTTDQFI